MDLLQTIILSIVEGVTEFLPISSTGHLVLTADLLKIPQTEFVKSFEISIQLGAILAIVFIYKNTLLEKTRYAIWSRILTAFFPTAVVGLFLYKFIKAFLIGNLTVTLYVLFIGGVLLIIFEKFYKEKNHALKSISDTSYLQCLVLGLFQSVSVIPGVSRAAATILGGLSIGLNRKTAVEFSFLLAVPTMLGATTLDLIKTNFRFSTQEYTILTIGFFVAFATAFVVVKYFLKYIEKHTFTSFGIYRILLSFAFWFYISQK